MIAGRVGVARAVRFVSAPVLIGLVSALVVLSFLAQMAALCIVPWATYPMIAAGPVIIDGLSRLTSVVHEATAMDLVPEQQDTKRAVQVPEDKRGRA